MKRLWYYRYDHRAVLRARSTLFTRQARFLERLRAAFDKLATTGMDLSDTSITVNLKQDRK